MVQGFLFFFQRGPCGFCLEQELCPPTKLLATMGGGKRGLASLLFVCTGHRRHVSNFFSFSFTASP